MPLQGLLVEEAQIRTGHANCIEIGFMPAGQVVGILNEIKPVAEIVEEIMHQYEQTVEALASTAAPRP